MRIKYQYLLLSSWSLQWRPVHIFDKVLVDASTREKPKWSSQNSSWSFKGLNRLRGLLSQLLHLISAQRLYKLARMTQIFRCSARTK